MEMAVTAAQNDMRRAYYSGAAGILASALAWSVATGVAAFASPQRAIWALLIGGALIHPIGVLICRLMGASAAHTKGNPFGQLAGASTFWLVFSLPLAYALGLRNPAWFFNALLLIIGGRYLVFATLYGMQLYWALGLALAAAGFALAALSVSAVAVVTAGAAIELVFAMAGIILHRKWVRANNSPNPQPLGSST
ncbi:DUF7010 family protein [Lysobacter korlensis]|uniref:DUF7010 family protein n=1 Tax=Lysobacter korlensis TaxID=553636 RepID=A0ABV6S034_9GAMM